MFHCSCLVNYSYILLKIGTFFFTVTVVISALGVTYGQETVEVECNQEGLIQCFDIALNVARATGCKYVGNPITKSTSVYDKHNMLFVGKAFSL